MEFFNSAIEVLQTLVVALGAGLGVWGTLIVIEQTLMILARRERENMFPIDHYDEGSLFAFKEILNDHASTGSTELMPFKHGING